MRRVAVLALAITVWLSASARIAPAIEELEAEEDIAELMPSRMPGEERPFGLQARKWALLPQFGYGPDTGILFGPKFAHRDLFGTNTTMDLDATYAINQQQSFALSLGSPYMFSSRFLVLLRAKYSLDPQRYFFGIGNNAPSPDGDPTSTHEFQETAGAITVGYRPFDRLAFNASLGVRQVAIRRGQRKDDIPFTQELESEGGPLPGIDGGTVQPIAVSLVWNTRDDVMRPTRGWRILLKIINTSPPISDFSFTRYVADAGYLRSTPDRRYVFGLRVNGEWISDPSDEVPFWELSELGGQDTLRGFFPHRFLGKGRVLVNGEVRARLTEFDFYGLYHAKIDGVLFVDGGRVFISHSDLKNEFKLNSDLLGRVFGDFQFSYGGGVRIVLSDALVARIDAGFSDEETGILYLSFGHTF